MKLLSTAPLVITIFLLTHHAQAARLVSAPTRPPPTRSTPKVKAVPKPAYPGGPSKRATGKDPPPPPPPPPPPGGDVNGAFCDIWKEDDCPETYRCIPEDLSSPPRCRKIDTDPEAVGNDCHTKGDNDGDTCDSHGMCIYGTCKQLCTGFPDDPQCPYNDEFCRLYPDSAAICEKRCDPTNAGDCEDGDEYCTTDSMGGSGAGNQFTCIHKPETGLGMEGAGCEVTSQCQQGFACVVKSSLQLGFCDDDFEQSCCARLATAQSDCIDGDILVPFYAELPPDTGFVGVCLHIP